MRHSPSLYVCRPGREGMESKAQLRAEPPPKFGHMRCKKMFQKQISLLGDVSQRSARSELWKEGAGAVPTHYRASAGHSMKLRTVAKCRLACGATSRTECGRRGFSNLSRPSAQQQRAGVEVAACSAQRGAPGVLDHRWQRWKGRISRSAAMPIWPQDEHDGEQPGCFGGGETLQATGG